MLSRECRVCGTSKPLNPTHYQPHTHGFRHECKECAKARRQTPEFRARQNMRRRERYANDLEFRKNILVEKRDRYANDPEYREKLLAQNRTPECRERKNARCRERRAIDTEWREEQNTQQRERYRTDPEYREKLLAQNRILEHRERKNARRRERRANDPEYRERENARRQTPEYQERRNARWRERYNNDLEFREGFKAYQRDRRLKDPEWWEEEKARRRELWVNDTERRERQNARQRERRASDPTVRETERANELIRRYDITMDDYEEMADGQNGVCAICLEEPETTWHVDHHHQTGQVRSLLCSGCNNGLGLLGEDTSLLLSAIRYLKLPEMQPQDIAPIPDERLYGRFEIPYWEEQSRDKRYRRSRNNNLRAKFSISIEQYESLLERGEGVCWVCFLPETNKSNEGSQYPDSLSVDHNHNTGMIRGLLCANCNIGIGKFRDDPEILEKAATYLEEWNE